MKNNFTDHQNCCDVVAAELQKKGFAIQFEYEIPVPIELQNYYERKKAVVDIYAKKGKQEILVEVGYLSQPSLWYGRIELLKKIKPDAKIIHVLQWKNYLTCYDFENEKLLYKAKLLALKNKNVGLVACISKGYMTDGFMALSYAKENNGNAFAMDGSDIIV